MAKDQGSPDPVSSDPDGSMLPASPADKPVVLDYGRAGTEPRLVTLCSMPSMEAQLARAKLESEDIPCFVADEAMAATHLALMDRVRLQVRDDDLERARQVLATPAANDTGGDYVDEDWRCPKCHRKTIELLPLASHWRRARMGCLAMLALPLLFALIRWLFPTEELARAMDQAVDWGLLPWFLITMVLGVAVMLARRGKRCSQCGWRSDQTAPKA